MSGGTISNTTSTYLPNARDRRSLRDIVGMLSDCGEDGRVSVDRRFHDMASQPGFPVASIKVPGREAMPLTRELADVLLVVAETLSKGRAVTVAPYDTSLTTQQAADMLGVSRPTLVKLLEEGRMAYRKVGRHRRIMLADVQEYAKGRHAEALARFDALSSETDPADTLDNPLISRD